MFGRRHTILFKFILFGVILGFFMPAWLLPAKRKLKRDYPITPVPFTQARVNDNFWAPRMETNRVVTIPFAFKKCEETGRIDNFLKAAGQKTGAFEGRRYNDSDVFKIIEGASYSLTLKEDPKLMAYLDNLVAKIASAQEDDGYLYTSRTIDPKHPVPGAGHNRWSNLGVSHELYNVGHLYEAAVAHFLATGKRTLLEVALKNANLICEVFGPGKRTGAPGHQEIEIGLTKLYRITGEKKYLHLAKFFLDQRGHLHKFKVYPKSSPFAVYNDPVYLQYHKPVIDQDEAVGHAVRAGYMYSGMADVAALTGDTNYIRAIDRIWENVVSKKMYLSGGIGSRHEGEAFGNNYELPNSTAYNETCAAIANIMWNHRLFLLHGDSKYIDVMERVLYNGFIVGVSLSGDCFFYPNPLQSDGKYSFNQGSTTRKPWFDCACCPANIARFLPSFPGYIYAFQDQSVYINLFVSSSSQLKLDKGVVNLRQRTNYPWQGEVKINVSPTDIKNLTIHLRIPGWARNRPIPSDLYRYIDGRKENLKLEVNGKPYPIKMVRGYAKIKRVWEKGDLITLVLPLPVRRVLAHPKVKENWGKVALERGPLVYCFEAVDNGGKVLNRILPDHAIIKHEYRGDLLKGIEVLRINLGKSVQELLAVPYFIWSHRGSGEMAVWLNRKK
jgi:DUF1680 family protein